MEGEGMAEQATSSAEQAKEKAQDKAQEATQQARRTLRDQVDSRSTQAGEQISQQAGDVRSLSQELRSHGKDGPAKIAEQAADRAEQVGSYLKRSDAERILDDAEGFARSNPWVVMAGGMAVGFVASRFLKASSSDRYHGRMTGQGQLETSTSGIENADRFGRQAPVGAPAVSPATTPQI
jgi:ElaB/YqjD/DUF883 family membrane-anchored ribosome-binding protein